MIPPCNIHCLALNYRGVGTSSDVRPLYFVKSSSAYCRDGAVVRIPRDVPVVWTEVELGIVVGRDCADPVDVAEPGLIAGYVVCADISCDNILGRDHHLAFSKSRTGFCPVGSDVVGLSLEQTLNLRMATYINGRETQTGTTEAMILNAHESLHYVLTLTGIQKGDIVLTGTPPGHENNALHPGDEVRHQIEAIGDLRYRIV